MIYCDCVRASVCDAEKMECQTAKALSSHIMNPRNSVDIISFSYKPTHNVCAPMGTTHFSQAHIKVYTVYFLDANHYMIEIDEHTTYIKSFNLSKRFEVFKCDRTHVAKKLD